MSFDYEQSIWGRGTASFAISDPTSIRFSNLMNWLKDIRAGDRVLEIGCGAGQFIRGVKKVRPEISCYGTDISLGAIKIAEGFEDGVKYLQQKDNELPFADGYFDAVFILDVLEHTVSWRAVLKEANRVLRNDGKLYVFVPCEGAKTSFWANLKKIGIGRDLTKKFAGHINYFQPAEVLGELSRLGFKNKVSFSEHFFGQLLGVAVFFAMDLRSKKYKDQQINNEAFFSNTGKNIFLNLIKKAVNAIIYIESGLFRNLPSPNLHVYSIKNNGPETLGKKP